MKSQGSLNMEERQKSGSERCTMKRPCPAVASLRMEKGATVQGMWQSLEERDGSKLTPSRIGTSIL